jgi:putative transposase
MSLFGAVVAGRVQLTTWGEIAQSQWIETGRVRDTIRLDSFVVMPNHLHAIVILDGARPQAGTQQRAPTRETFSRPTPRSVPSIVRMYKATVTRCINHERCSAALPVWQRGYYEHVLRNEDDLRLTREYIENNPLRWSLEKDH